MNMSYLCSIFIVILFVKQNILILFKRNPRVTKTSHMWKNLLMFFFCILIKDIFYFWRCPTKGAALRKGSKSSKILISIIPTIHVHVEFIWIVKNFLNKHKKLWNEYQILGKSCFLKIGRIWSAEASKIQKYQAFPIAGLN